MFPIYNSNNSGKFPVVTISLIAVNLTIFITLFANGTVESAATNFGFVNNTGLHTLREWFTLLTATFLHGGWWHVVSNMWFLWIFGPRLEGVTGRWFLPLYIFGGLFAGIGSMFIAPHTGVGAVGASGAISFLIGMYWVMFPHDKIWSVNPMFQSIGGGDKRYIVELSAWFAIILWFALQLIPAFMGALAGLPDADGVGYSAHISGVVAGLLIGRYWKKKVDTEISKLDSELIHSSS